MDADESHTGAMPAVDWDIGVDAFVEAYLDAAGMHDHRGARVVRVRINRAFVDYMRAKMRLVSDQDLLSVKSIKFPGAELVRSDDDKSDFWCAVIDDEALRLQPDQGPDGSTTPSIYLQELDSLFTGTPQGDFSWRAGFLLFPSGMGSTTTLVRNAERTFPEFAAALKAEAMAARIAETRAARDVDEETAVVMEVAARRRTPRL